ncbi:MAG: hypothetical protein NZ580_07435 [Bacteroidia bacterium]|nr:hypothetical protein [Bacteroidia bacterium]MDW8236348.1 regulatory iron-sulfur-containing complex subunit RicT [Bacteroidia bacterium]
MGCAKGCKGCSTAELFQQWASVALSTVPAPPLVEVRFKGTRREIFHADLQPSLRVGEWVVVPEVVRRSIDGPAQQGKGYDIGQVALTGHLAEKRRLTLQRTVENWQKVLRRATPEDLERFTQLRLREPELLRQMRKLVEETDLGSQNAMKITDVELTGDGQTLICYFTAEGRVDFRDLLRKVAEQLKLRPDMRQINPREESGRLGGIGDCGRETCCSTWMIIPPPVTAENARIQGFSLSSTKSMGLCGRLKCCLNYELEVYREILARIPQQVEKIETQQGSWKYLRTELLLERMWFLHPEEGKQVCLPVSAVTELLEMNKRGEKPASLDSYAVKFPDLATRI